MGLTSAILIPGPIHVCMDKAAAVLNANLYLAKPLKGVTGQPEEESAWSKEEEKQDLGETRSSSVAVNEEEKEKRFGDKSRFLPEVIDPNRVTIV